MAKRALIIDDDIDLCLLLSRFLNKNGFETSSAHSGAKGIALYDPANFDVVICDYRLDDMDGIKLIKGLKAKDPHVRILVITGYSDIKTAVDVIKLGAYDYITKPLIPDEVLNVLSAALNQPESSKPAMTTISTTLKSSSKKQAVLNSEYLVGEAGATQELYKQIEI